MTGIRAIAAAWVLAYHYRPTLFALLPSAQMLDPLLRCGYLGVDLFFTLSGFILYYNYRDRFRAGVTKAGYRDFLMMRLARLYPVHLVTLHLSVASILLAKAIGLHLSWAEWVDYSFRSYLANLAMIHAWFWSKLSWNAPAWSISAEWFAYLFLPFIALVVSRVRWRGLAWLGAAASYAAMLAVFAFVLGFSGTVTQGALVRITGEFIAGCFLCHVFSRGVALAAWGPLSIAVLGAVVAGTWIVPSEDGRAIILAPLFGLLILSLAYDRGPLARLLSTRTLRYGGQISYCVYMVHEIMYSALGVVMPRAKFQHAGLHVRAAILTAHFAAIVVAAAVLYRFVEVPGRRWIRSLARSATTAQQRQGREELSRR